MLDFNTRVYFTSIAQYLLELSIFCQNVKHIFFRWFQESPHEMKGPVASFLAASYQTGILNAHSLQKYSTR